MTYKIHYLKKWGKNVNSFKIKKVLLCNPFGFFFLALTQDNVLLNWKQSIKFEFSKAYLLIPLVHLVCLLDMPGITFFFTGQCIFPIRPIATDPLPQFHLISYTFYSLLKILQCKIKYKYYIEKIKMSFMPSYIIQTQQQVDWYFSALAWLWYRQLNALAVQIIWLQK